jgi:hypothetical protein
MKKSVLGLVLLGVLGLASVGQAQTVCTANCVVLRDEPFSVAATHDAVETDGYRVRFNGTIVADASSSQVWTNGTVTVPFTTGWANAGTFTVTMSAYNRDIDGSIAETVSQTLSLTVRSRRAPPGQVTNLRVVTANR